MSEPRTTPREVGRGNRAASPVIGVILMVAITVIIASIIGGFVFNVGGQVEESVQAGANVEAEDGEIKVTWSANQNADRVEAEVGSSCSGGAASTTLNSVGDGHTFTCGTGNDVQVTVTAVRDGEARTVLLTKTYEL